MEFCGCLNIDCSQCLELNIPYCPPTLINIPTTNLVPYYTAYYLWIIDKMGNAFMDSIFGNGDGSFTINQANFPTGMFSNKFGKRDVFLTTDSGGANVQVLKYGGITYNCIMLGVSNPDYLTDDNNCNYLTDDSGNILIAQ